jgi:hypothetical protein
MKGVFMEPNISPKSAVKINLRPGMELCIDQRYTGKEPAVDVEISLGGQESVVTLPAHEMAALLNLPDSSALREGVVFRIEPDGSARNITGERMCKIAALNHRLTGNPLDTPLTEPGKGQAAVTLAPEDIGFRREEQRRLNDDLSYRRLRDGESVF